MNRSTSLVLAATFLLAASTRSYAASLCDPGPASDYRWTLTPVDLGYEGRQFPVASSEAADPGFLAQRPVLTEAQRLQSWPPIESLVIVMAAGINGLNSRFGVWNAPPGSWQFGYGGNGFPILPGHGEFIGSLHEFGGNMGIAEEAARAGVTPVIMARWLQEAERIRGAKNMHLDPATATNSEICTATRAHNAAVSAANAANPYNYQTMTPEERTAAAARGDYSLLWGTGGQRRAAPAPAATKPAGQ